MQLAQAVNFGQIQQGLPVSGQANGLFHPRFASGGLGYLIEQGIIYSFIIAGIALLLYIISGGFKLMTSGGDPGKTKEAHSILTNGVTGFLIIFIAYWVMQAVGQIFGILDIQNTFK